MQRSLDAWITAALLLGASIIHSAMVPTASAAEMYAACTPSVRAVTEPVRSGGRPPGALVLGLTDPNQVYSVAPGTTIQGDVYAFNSAVLSIAGTAQLAGNLYLVDHAAVRVIGADLTVPNTHALQYRWLATDDASIEITDSRVSLGAAAVYNRQVLCGRAHASVLRSDFTAAPGSTNALFAWEDARVTLTASQGNFELSVDHAGRAEVADQHQSASGHTVVYFSVRSTIASSMKLVSGTGLTQSIAFPADSQGRSMTADIRTSDIIFALRVDPGAGLSLVDSSLAILLTTNGNSKVRSLAPGVFASQTIDFGDRTVSLTNTQVWLWSAYLDGTSGSLDLTDAWLGELICTSWGTATCRGQRVMVDGSGGYVSAIGTAQMTLENSMITTYVTALDRSTIRLRSSLVVRSGAPSGQPTPWLQSSQNSLIVLENSGYDPSVSLVAEDGGAIANATIENPGSDTPALARGPLLIRGTAAVRSAASSPNAFVSYTLTAAPVAGGATVTIARGKSPVESGTLATWNTGSLAAGTYDLHLVLTGRSGVIADVTRRVVLT